jgi:hypothetical protein
MFPPASQATSVSRLKLANGPRPNASPPPGPVGVASPSGAGPGICANASGFLPRVMRTLLPAQSVRPPRATRVPVPRPQQPEGHSFRSAAEK